MTFIRYEKGNIRVDDLIQGDVKLASPPEIYARLRRMIDSPSSTLSMVAGVIEQDPALTARVLKVVNSAFYALPVKVDSVTDAVSYLGVRDVRDLVFATEVIKRFDNLPEELVDIYAFWRESLRCAVLCRQLASVHPGGVRGEQLFLAGLLHGIGHLVIYSRVPELARKALREHRYRRRPLYAMEREVMGCDYAQVGAALARRWELPELLCVVIDHHIEPEQAQQYRTETALVHLALSAGEAGSFVATEVDRCLPEEPGLWASAGVTPAELKAVLGDAEMAFGAALALLR